jgi:hypothetical protein
MHAPEMTSVANSAKDAKAPATGPDMIPHHVADGKIFFPKDGFNAL